MNFRFCVLKAVANEVIALLFLYKQKKKQFDIFSEYLNSKENPMRNISYTESIVWLDLNPLDLLLLFDQIKNISLRFSL